jgi:hypothetical protein
LSNEPHLSDPAEAVFLYTTMANDGDGGTVYDLGATWKPVANDPAIEHPPSSHDDKTETDKRTLH